MGFLNTLKERFFGDSVNVVSEKTISLMGGEPPATKRFDYLNAFRASSLVHTGTSKIAEKIAGIDIELYKVSSKNAVEIEQHEILDLLTRP